MPESHACNLCGNTDPQPLPKKSRLLQLRPPNALVRCKRCDLVYMDPRPTPAEILDLYARSPNWNPQSIATFPRREAFDRAKMERLAQFQPVCGSMLIIACLEAYFPANARTHGWDVLGVEFVQTLLDHLIGRLSLPVVVSPLWDLAPLEGRKFDAICSHSLEHVPDPRRTLRQCREMLAPGGVLMLEVPNQIEALKERIKLVLYTLIGDRLLPHLWPGFDPYFHLWYFTPATLRRLLAAEGFEVLALRTYLPQHPGYLRNPRARWLQELMYRLGGPFGGGPSIEVYARPIPA